VHEADLNSFGREEIRVISLWIGAEVPKETPEAAAQRQLTKSGGKYRTPMLPRNYEATQNTYVAPEYIVP
jgi:hypothetical protein